MAYNRTVWRTNDLITANNLNNNEEQLDMITEEIETARDNCSTLNQRLELLQNTAIAATSSDAVQNGYVENGIAYFLNGNDEILFTITGIGGGGGGGGGSSSSATLTASKIDSWLSKTIALGSPCAATIHWTSLEGEEPTGDGSIAVIIANITREILNVSQGDISINLAKYLEEGTNSITLLLKDSYNNTKRFNYTVNAVSLNITSSFDTSIPYNAAFNFTCGMTNIPDKTIHIELDGESIADDPVSLRSYTILIPAQQHGMHTLRAWFSVELNQSIVSSNVLYYEFMATESENNDPIITSDFDVTSMEQYYSVNIPYRVFNPNSATTNITIYENNVEKATLTVDTSLQTYSFYAGTPGQNTIRIAASAIIYKDFTITVTASSAEIEAETQNLDLYLTARGRSNNEASRAVWTNNGYSATFSNFDWTLDGWQKDEEGTDVLRVRGDGRVTIPYQIFSSNNALLSGGKTIEIEFATREVCNYNSNIITCFNNNIGLRITSQNINIKGAQTEIGTLYKDNEHIRLSITIDKQTDNRLILVYIDGIMSRAIQYAVGENFQQSAPQGITIGSNDCGIDIYNIRIYNNNLSAMQIVNNWIADTANGEQMLDRYLRNKVYTAQEEITIESLGNALPYMVIESETLPTSKGDKKTVSGRYVDPLNSAKSFTFTDCEIDVQGTSSSVYYVKNLDMKFKQGFVMNDGTTASKYGLRANSIPFNRFVLKADVASSEAANNTGLVMFYNDTCPYKVPEMIENPNVRWGIEGVPIVMFWYNPTNNKTTFMGKYNFNLPKRAPAPYGYSDNDESWEVERNNSGNVKFQDNDFTTMSYDPISGESYPEWYDDFEARFPEDTWRDITQLNAFVTFIKSTDREQATGDSLGSSVTYDGVTYTTDTAAYRLAKFKAEFPKWAELNSAIYYYLFTEMFLMIDSRAKNMFVGFHGSTNEDGSIPLARKAVFEPYDMDTAIGTNNSGILMFGYNLEDTDHVSSVISGSESGGSNAVVFNGQESVLWCNVRDAFRAEIVNMYRSLRSGNIPAWSYEKIEQHFESHQSKWSEVIYNQDAYVKYLTPLIEEVTYDEDSHRWIKTDRYLTMLQGSKKEQRKWWLYNRFRYMDSKYLTGDAATRTLDLRLFNSGTLSLKTAIDMYAAVRFGLGSTPRMERTAANTTVSFPYETSAGVTEMETSIYSGDMITDVGDLSVFYPNELNFSKATKLKTLKVGSNAANYSNANLTTIDVSNCVLLESIDCRNCPNLNISVDLSNSPLLKTAYFDGTSISGVALAEGGDIETLSLPDTITTLELINLSQLTNFSVENNDYSNISRLMLANIDSTIVNPVTLLDEIHEEAYVYIEGLDITMSSASDIEDFLDTLDTFKGVSRDWNAATQQWIYHYFDKPQVSGTIHINSLTGDKIALYHERYPNIFVDAITLTNTVYYYNFEGDTLLHTEIVGKYENATWDGAPTHEQTVGYTFVFSGWSLNKESGVADPNCRNHIYGDVKVYAAYTLTARKYDISFYNGDILVFFLANKDYGSKITYTDADPIYPVAEEAEYYRFEKWMTDDGIVYTAGMLVQGPYIFKARYKNMQNIFTQYLQDKIINFENTTLTTLKPYTFYRTVELKTIDISGVDGTVNGYALEQNNGLKSIKLSYSNFESHAIEANNAVTTIELTNNNLITLAPQAISQVNSLEHVIIRSNEVAALSSTDIFSGSYIRSRLGGIYVPTALVEDYKAATNWSYFNRSIYPIVEEDGNFVPLADYATIHSDNWDTINRTAQVGDLVILPTIGNDGETIIYNYIEAIARNTDIKEDGTTAKITWLCYLSGWERVNSPIANWSTDSTRTWLNDTFITKLPLDLQNLIVPVSKITGIDEEGTEATTLDKIWIPSAYEMGANNFETNGVRYYTIINNDTYPCIKFGALPDKPRKQYWLRSYHKYVGADGGVNSTNDMKYYQLIFGFCCDYEEEN